MKLRAEGTGKCVYFLCKLNIFMLANFSRKDDSFAEEINAKINKRIFPSHVLGKGCKKPPPYFFHVHLFHHLYGVDAPELIIFNNKLLNCEEF